jgi:hypothetical protein
VTDFQKALASRAQVDAWTPDDAPSTWSETFSAAWASARREELSSSADNAWQKQNQARAKKIGELGGDERLALAYDPRLAERLRKREAEHGAELGTFWWLDASPLQRKAFQEVRRFERQYPDQVLDDEGLMEQFKTEAAELRKAEEHTRLRGPGTAEFVGTGAAIMTDPLILLTLGIGAEVGAGRTLLATIGRTAAAEGAIGMAVELPIQAQVAAFKRELEAPWSFRDSAMNVLSAGLGGAVIGGTIGAGVFGGRKLLDRYRTARESGQIDVTPDLEHAEEILEQTLQFHRENPLLPERLELAEGEVGISPAAAERVHEQAYDLAKAQHDAGRPVDVGRELEGWEQSEPIGQVIRRTEDPAELIDLDPLELEVDARTFQFKTGSDGAGVTDALKDVKRFDRRLAGVALVWERADGRRFIADGHQRLALAQRALEAGQDPGEVRLNGFLLREADGITAADARQMAAIKNMAEGSGSALDAAKILREVGPMGEAMLPPLPPRSALVRQARGLATLGEDEFFQVINGLIDVRYGALVGTATTDPRLQAAMIDIIRKTQPANDTQAHSIIEQVKTQGVEVRTTEDLFGEQSFSESLYLERAQVLDAALREARNDRAVFGRLVAEEGRITEAGGNRLDRQANQQRIEEATSAATQIAILANSKGPLSDALTDAARTVKGGARPGAAAADFLKAARRAILEGDHRRGAPGGARPGGDPPRAERVAPEPKVGEPVNAAGMSEAQKNAAQDALIARQRQQSIDELYQVAEKHQAALRRAAADIVDELGEDVQLADPGIKLRETAEDKLVRKGVTAGELTDVIRLGFLVRTPELAARIIARLSETFEVLDEGVTVTGMGYLDHKALVRFTDGRVGEVQLWEPSMAEAKFGQGHELYQAARAIDAEAAATDPALARELEAIVEASKDLYAQALAAGSPEWRRLAMMRLPEDMRARVQAALDAGAGSGGEPGNVSRKAAREISSPDSSTSTGAARDQAPESRGTKKASSPPAGVSRTTAGRASQLKNRSAIDSPPRSIVRQVDDPRSPEPDTTRTGTVPDIEYEAVMSRAAELIEEQGSLLTVADEVNGELQIRTAAGRLEELDLFEETLERVRVCNTTGRAA